MAIKRKTQRVTALANTTNKPKLLEGSEAFTRKIIRIFAEVKTAQVDIVAQINEETFVQAPVTNLDGDDFGMMWPWDLVAGEELNLGLRDRAGASQTQDVTVEYDEVKV